MEVVKRGRGRPPKDETGKRYGILTVIRKGNPIRGVWTKYQTYSWVCRCDCGRECLRTGRDLRNCSRQRTTPNCGCLVKVQKELNGKPEYNIAMYRCAGGAREAGRAFELSYAQFVDLITKSCFYCGAAPSPKKTTGKRKHYEWMANGIDRVDNRVGYVVGNCVPCCTMCNRAKGENSQEKFLTWALNVANHSTTRIANSVTSECAR